MFHLSLFGSVVEAAEFEDEFFLGGECNTKKMKFKFDQKEAPELIKI
jgi:hypothetical protein